MAALMITLLAGLSGFLAIRLHSAVSENSALRTHVASLKRQLQRR
jgi:hypothetical protein